MSEDTKGRTMIGTVAPSSPPRQAPPSLAQGSPTPPPEPPPATIRATSSQLITSAPTIGMGPAPAGATVAGGDPDIFIGQELKGYTVRRKLAEGGMGVVYEAERGQIGRIAAIKVLKLEFCRSEAVIERFYQEARAVNAIRHENIVDIYDFGRDPDGRVFFVMEYLEGEPLSARLRRGKLSWSEAFPILEQILRALKAAHDKGFIHRDLKPDNIWLRQVEGKVQVKLLDFGIAKLVGTESPRDKLTQTGAVIGTPHYMSPEQINGSKDVDQRTDIYALGVVIYEMFTGVTPFSGNTLQAVMTGHLFTEPPRLADLPADLGVPEPIAEIVDRMLVKDPAGRYGSASEVLGDLHDVSLHRLPANAEALSHTWPTRVPSVAPAPAAPPRTSRKRALIGGALAGTVLAIAAIVIFGTPRSSVAPASMTKIERNPEPPPPLTVPPESPPDYPALRKDAQSTLRASLRESEPIARIHGANALGKIKDQESTPALAGLTEHDPDAMVRGRAADALGAIGAASTAGLLGKLETAAPPPLKVWYASALAQLGDKRAVKRLRDYAHSKDLAISFAAALALAEVSQPGDRKTIKALEALVPREAELHEEVPYAGAKILTRMAGLRDPRARKALYAALEHTNEGARLAAAEGLASLGDDAGRKVLESVVANHDSPNRLVAAVVQIALGEYGGREVITKALGDKDPEMRRLAARGIGEIGEPKSLQALVALTHDADWTVRIAAAGAIVAIVGLDPKVLAQASVDWTRNALRSDDWAVRKAAAGVLADIPEKEAVPLLAQAIQDRDPNVRLAASRSAGKMQSAEAATEVATAVKAETDPGVKEEQVKALGEIGDPVARDTLAEIAQEPGRIGVIAAGSLIAVGDTSGKAKLDEAVVAPQADLRLAAVQAASAANHQIVVPTLKLAIADRVFEVRFTAAEGLSLYNAEKAAAVPVLQAALEAKDGGIVGRAMAALVRLGERVAGAPQTPSQMLDEADPKRRLAVVPVVRSLPVSEAVPLLRRLIVDPDTEVRHAGVDAIEDVVAKDKDEAIKLYRPLLDDADPVVRSKASGQLAELVPTPIIAAPSPPPTAPPAPATPPAPDDDKLADAREQVREAQATAETALAEIETIATELAARTAVRGNDVAEQQLQEVKDLSQRLDEARARLADAATSVERAATSAADAAGTTPSQEAAQLVTDARAIAQAARDKAQAASDKATQTAKKAGEWVELSTGDASILIAACETALAAGNLADAKHNCDRAAKRARRAGEKHPSLDYLYGGYYDAMAEQTPDPAAKRALLQQALDAYRRFAATGAGRRARHAGERIPEITAEIQRLGVP
jgi:serine/threonine protein kinase/HEAT repeat protein